MQVTPTDLGGVDDVLSFLKWALGIAVVVIGSLFGLLMKAREEMIRIKDEQRKESLALKDEQRKDALAALEITQDVGHVLDGLSATMTRLEAMVPQQHEQTRAALDRARSELAALHQRKEGQL